eukprot:GCRY01003778.1.p1 GENE.GCRY01003778.1~~GCRY01003778.1.p1  ORF type:complete len:518 (+),score=78.39 GCRY01003778.1:187-1740(+)
MVSNSQTELTVAMESSLKTPKTPSSSCSSPKTHSNTPKASKNIDTPSHFSSVGSHTYSDFLPNESTVVLSQYDIFEKGACFPRSPRFSQTALDTPGPGTYNLDYQGHVPTPNLDSGGTRSDIARQFECDQVAYSPLPSLVDAAAYKKGVLSHTAPRFEPIQSANLNGPAQFNLMGDLLRDGDGNAVMKSSRERFSSQPSTPGVGDYDLTKFSSFNSQPNAGERPMSASFASGVAREAFKSTTDSSPGYVYEPKEVGARGGQVMRQTSERFPDPSFVTPGPQDYQVKDVSAPNGTKLVESTAKRFPEAKIDTPGPGSYDVPRDGVRIEGEKGADGADAGFGTEPRVLRHSLTHIALDSPGYVYNPNYDAVSRGSTQGGVKAASGISKSERFDTIALTPGPGDYDLTGSESGPTADDSLDRSFGSKSKRFTVPSSPAPGVGKYSGSDAAVAKHSPSHSFPEERRKPAFKANNQSPGPKYSPRSTHVVITHRFSKSPRFASPKRSSPGPGSYSPNYRFVS